MWAFIGGIVDDKKARAAAATKRWLDKQPAGYAAAKVKEWREKNPEKKLDQWRRQSSRRSAKGPRRRNTQTPCARCGVLDRMPSGGCRPCTIARNAERKARDPETVRLQANERSKRHRNRLPKSVRRQRQAKHGLSRALRDNGITLEQYDAMVIAQENRCAICKNKEAGRFARLAIDHNHTTGKVRALLCARCNLVLGQFNDDVALLQAAIGYLTLHTETRRMNQTQG